MTPPPNFLVITVDQMRADHLGCTGNPIIRTPNLDALAAEGIHLKRAYVNNPLCMPSRATLLTGQTPRGHGVRTNGIPLRHGSDTVPEVLARKGYATASIGKLHLTNYELHEQRPELRSQLPELRDRWLSGEIHGMPTPYFGFERIELTIGHGDAVAGDYTNWLKRDHPKAWEALTSRSPAPSPLGAEGCGTFQLEEDLHHTAYVADRTISYLRSAVEGKPFFLMCSFPDPHHPYVVPQPWDRKYDPTDVPAPIPRGDPQDLHPLAARIRDHDIWVSGRRKAARMSEAHRREIIAYTYGMVSLLDKHIGRILTALDDFGLRERTVVVFLSDHGDMMGDHELLNKGPFHFEGLLRVPLIWSWPGRFTHKTSDALASLLDVSPTILELAGADLPDAGVPQQLPALPGASLVPLLTSEREHEQESVVIENDEDYLGLRLRTLVTNRYKLTTYTERAGASAHGELYDLQDDPLEQRNLWNDPEYSPLKSELQAMLLSRLIQTDSTLPRRIGHA